MAHSEEPVTSSDQQPYLIVAALADGEHVESEGLRAALADPAVRDYLVDLVALRQAVGTMAAENDTRWRERRSVLSLRGWMTAAAVVLLSVTGGYVAGQRTGVQAAPAPMVETVVNFGGSAAAPQPTRIVTLQPGVNWTENVEGR
jgi:hypothetical protein